ncbi:hypothetical protein LguiA_001999 [Lonicera macranthoides]
MAPISTTTFTSFLFFFLLHHIFVHSLTRPTGFTTDLIHREFSPLSPFYDQSNTKFDRLRNTIHRSFSLLSKPSSSPNTIQSEITPVSGEYLMNVSIGTPPFNILSIASTGSDLTWTQCQPCTHCFKENSPLFNPENSSTYTKVPCNSRPCAAVTTSTCSANNYCRYNYSYGDNSFTQGDIAVDAFTFGSTSGRPVTIPSVIFGCGHANVGTFTESSSGMVGLGGGPLSIINQLENSIKGKFSYCLVPLNKKSKTSKINFGNNAVVSGTGVVSTPLITKSPSTFYYINLEKITVGDQTLEFKASLNSRKGDVEGNIIIDSGTTLTLLPSDLHSGLVSKVKENVNENPIRDSNGLFDLCYSIGDNGGVENLNLPNITFHFTGADVDLTPTETFMEVEEGLVCLTIVPSDEFAIFGNLSQMNFLIGYDLVKNQVSFKRTDCSKQQ